MINLYNQNRHLNDLPPDQTKTVNNWGARLLGLNAGVVDFLYAITAICVLAVSKELHAHLLLLGSVVGLLVVVSVFRFFAGLRLSKVAVKKTNKYLNRYGWWSLANAFCIGLFATVMIYKVGLNQQFLFMIVVMAGISSISIGNMSLYSKLWATFTMFAWLPLVIACLYAGYSGISLGYFLAVFCLFYSVLIVLVGNRIANECWRGQVAIVNLATKTRDLEYAFELSGLKELDIRKHRLKTEFLSNM